MFCHFSFTDVQQVSLSPKTRKKVGREQPKMVSWSAEKNNIVIFFVQQTQKYLNLVICLTRFYEDKYMHSHCLFLKYQFSYL